MCGRSHLSTEPRLRHDRGHLMNTGYIGVAFAAAVTLAGSSVTALAFAQTPTCTTDNLLAHKILIENASVTLDGCNRAVVSTGQWFNCELSAEIPEKMPWVRDCLSERLAANLSRLDSLRDPPAAEVTELSNEASRLEQMGDALTFYLRLMRANVGLQVEALRRANQGAI